MGLPSPSIWKASAPNLQLPLSQTLNSLDFLSLSPFWGTMASIDDSPETVMERMGLDGNKYAHCEIFERMQEEARKTRDILCGDKKSLTPNAKGRSDLLPPYQLEDISEDAFTEELDTMYTSANPDVFCILDLMASESRHWALRWLLWHAMEESAKPSPSHVLPDSPGQPPSLLDHFPASPSHSRSDISSAASSLSTSSSMMASRMNSTPLQLPDSGMDVIPPDRCRGKPQAQPFFTDSDPDVMDLTTSCGAPLSNRSSSLYASSSGAFWDPIRDC